MMYNPITRQGSMHYLKCEDLATCFVGPFETLEQAGEHAKLIIVRGDSGSITPFHEQQIDYYRRTYGAHFTLYTPEQDIEFWEKTVAPLHKMERGEHEYGEPLDGKPALEEICCEYCITQGACDPNGGYCPHMGM
jgi:hypothetical protein